MLLGAHQLRARLLADGGEVHALLEEVRVGEEGSEVALQVLALLLRGLGEAKEGEGG